MESVAVRAKLLFGATMKPTLPEPLPVVPSVIVIHGCWPEIDHGHPGALVTTMPNDPPSGLKVVPLPDNEGLQAGDTVRVTGICVIGLEPPDRVRVTDPS